MANLKAFRTSLILHLAFGTMLILQAIRIHALSIQIVDIREAQIAIEARQTKLANTQVTLANTQITLADAQTALASTGKSLAQTLSIHTRWIFMLSGHPGGR